MIIFLTGVSCVGKSTIGEQLAKKLGYIFYDLDIEVEKFYGKPISRLQSEWIFPYTFRKNSSKVLEKVIKDNKDHNLVIALPPSGLSGPYYRVIKKTEGTTIALKDSPENILSRITFYDEDSHRIDKKLSDREKKLYLKAIKGEISYFAASYKKANYCIDLAGLGIVEATNKVHDFLIKPILLSPQPKPQYTQKQGQYLAFISSYTMIHRMPPSEAEIQKYFKIAPPTVHQMILKLEELGFISRLPRQPRSIKVLLQRKDLPDLEEPDQD